MAKGLMNLEEVSEYLGGWSEKTIKVLAEEKKLGIFKFPGVMIGSKWFFSRSLIDKWIEEFVKKFRGQTLEEEALIKKIKESEGGAMTKEEMEAVSED